MSEETTGKISAEKGLSLFYRYREGDPDKPLLLFIHGMGEHSGRYGHPVKFFGELGYPIFAYDQRGHGRSDGRRTYADSFARFLGDLNKILKTVRKKVGERPIVLVGHSFGAQVALTFGARHPQGLAGVIVSSPNLRLAMPVPWLKKRAGLLLSYLVPVLALDAGIDPEHISHDPAEVKAYQEDPLVIKTITVRLASEMFANQDRMLQHARSFTLPCLLMHGGDDLISDPLGTEDFFHACSSSDKTLEIYPGFYHEIFNEVDKLAVFRDMKAWLAQRF